MISYIKKYIRKCVADELPPTSFYRELKIAVQAQAGRIKILEEQQEIMHNFLVEINKYLVTFTDNHKKGNEMGYESMKPKPKAKKPMNEGSTSGKPIKRKDMPIVDKLTAGKKEPIVERTRSKTKQTEDIKYKAKMRKDKNY